MLHETYNSNESDYSDDSFFFGSGELCESGDYGRFVDFCEVTYDSVDFGKSFDFSESTDSVESDDFDDSVEFGDPGEYGKSADSGNSRESGKSGYPCNSVDFCEVTNDSVDSGVTELGDSGENGDSGYLIVLVNMVILVIMINLKFIF